MPVSKSRRKKKSSAKAKPPELDFITLDDLGPLQEFLAELGDSEEEADALVEAQELVYDAWEARTRKRRIDLARKALEISPDCADAYVLLAEEAAKSLDEKIDIYRRGVEAGERAVGPESFEEDIGHFWGLLETRPYMRARSGLAVALWLKGEKEEAVEHFRDLLRLNPNDNQGIRYILAARYLDLGWDDDLSALLKAYKDDIAAVWTYSRALLAYRRQGDTKRSRKLLSQAIASNPHVPDYLLGKSRLPKKSPEYIGIGDEREAIAYVQDCASGWTKVPASLDWLNSFITKEGRV